MCLVGDQIMEAQALSGSSDGGLGDVQEAGDPSVAVVRQAFPVADRDEEEVQEQLIAFEALGEIAQELAVDP
jgi:hypothetical protein